MKIKEVIGIDVSKLTLDCYDHNSSGHKVFENDLGAISTMASWALQITGGVKEQLLFVFEHTGLYTNQLIQYLSDKGYLYAVVPGLEIKRSLGIVRGKDDKADAKRIALYGYRLKDEIKLGQVSDQTLKELKGLMSLRRKLVAQRAGHETRLNEQLRVLNTVKDSILFETQRNVIQTLKDQIQVIEQELDRIIKEDPRLQNLYRLITSIKGIGPITAMFLIVYTGAFTKFDNWRKFASYCGIAPFPNRSGISIRGKSRVSHLANKEGKRLFDLCAKSAIRFSWEMKAYYERKVKEGKSKVGTLNIIRNKLLSRAFAVVNRSTPYVDVMGYAA